MLRLLVSVILSSVLSIGGANAKELSRNVHGARLKRLPDIEIKHAVRQGTLQFSAKGTRNLDMSVYLFEASGKLVGQAALKNNQTISLSMIPKGAYLFEIFSDDLRIENGTVIVR